MRLQSGVPVASEQGPLVVTETTEKRPPLISRECKWKEYGWCTHQCYTLLPSPDTYAHPITSNDTTNQVSFPGLPSLVPRPLFRSGYETKISRVTHAGAEDVTTSKRTLASWRRLKFVTETCCNLGADYVMLKRSSRISDIIWQYSNEPLKTAQQWAA